MTSRFKKSIIVTTVFHLILLVCLLIQLSSKESPSPKGLEVSIKHINKYSDRSISPSSEHQPKQQTKQPKQQTKQQPKQQKSERKVRSAEEILNSGFAPNSNMQSKHSQKTSSSKKRDLQSLSDFIGGSKVSVSGSSTSTSEWNEYIRKVTEIIKRHWDAPQTATKGSYVQLSITISRSGRILSSSVKGFSGGNSLKNSGIRCLKKIKSFPDFPKSVKNSQDTLSVKLVVN